MSSADAPESLAFIDLETSGLHPAHHHVLEVGIVLVDAALEEIAALELQLPLERSVVLAEMSDDVRAMHTDNGLLEAVEHATRVLAETTEGHASPSFAYLQAELQIEEFFQAHGCPVGQLILSGHSIQFDRRFLEARLPAAARWLHYRQYDTGGISRFLRRYGGVPLPPTPTMPHRGLADARLELAEACLMVDLLRERFGGSRKDVLSHFAS